MRKCYAFGLPAETIPGPSQVAVAFRASADKIPRLVLPDRAQSNKSNNETKSAFLQVPTLSEWAMVLLAAILAPLGYRALRRAGPAA